MVTLPFLQRKTRYQAGLIAGLETFEKHHAIIRPGSFKLPTKRRSSREDTTSPAAAIMTIMFRCADFILLQRVENILAYLGKFKRFVNSFFCSSTYFFLAKNVPDRAAFNVNVGSYY
jgi:hypothetical protein